MKRDQSPRIWQSILVAMLIPLTFVAFWPTPVDQPVQGFLASILTSLHGHGFPHWFDYKCVEAVANLILFVPLGFVAKLAFPAKRWWQVTYLGLFISCCIELGQLLFLQNRFASPLDLVTNTSGAVLGALLAALVAKKLKARNLPATRPQSAAQ